jgi:hypothetical protein
MFKSSCVFSAQDLPWELFPITLEKAFVFKVADAFSQMDVAENCLEKHRPVLAMVRPIFAAG